MSLNRGLFKRLIFYKKTHFTALSDINSCIKSYRLPILQSMMAGVLKWVSKLSIML